ncbi:MAG: AhpC/TSA family protein [Bacteroidetes bacterium]|nr:AhpC/TSA family protein [Bacteroidota bacterium]MBU1371767.1 AhpC/TSA family protein [Bacteroidota bacterium]MBU1485353.1 AhpC/TSA family protein [Bacteroidota bacterium]MBU1762185.1 AhpC/TSA family protein [Bacteroidota bacterium]MBU2266573.1 AhpC/TSA family protein [Bacteroidota bacterium]
MKKFLITLLSLAPIFAFAQSNFHLKGEVKNLSTDKNIYLIHIVDQVQKLDSAVVKNGKFEFNIKVSSPAFAALLLDQSGTDLTNRDSPKDIFRFFIDAGNATLIAKDSIAKAKVTGLPIFQEHEDLLSALKPIEQKLVDLNKEFNQLSPDQMKKENLVKTFQDRYEALMESRKTTMVDFIKSHPNSYVSLYTLNGDLAVDNMNTSLVEAGYKGLSAHLKENPLAIYISKKLEKAKTLDFGQVAPDFEEKTAEQIPIKLSSFKGQYVLVDFWASWCGPCRQENPNVLRAYETFKDKNFTILGVSIDENSANWTKAVKADGLVWTQILDRTQIIAATYGVVSIPRNFLLDPEGKIIAKNLRGPELIDKLKEVLKDQKSKN